MLNSGYGFSKHLFIETLYNAALTHLKQVNVCYQIISCETPARVSEACLQYPAPWLFIEESEQPTVRGWFNDELLDLLEFGVGRATQKPQDDTLTGGEPGTASLHALKGKEPVDHGAGRTSVHDDMHFETVLEK